LVATGYEACAGIQVNSALEELSVIVDRSDVQEFLASRALQNG
jgi:hypothetical protein